MVAVAACAAVIVVAGVAALRAHDLVRSESRLDVHGSTVECQLIVDLLEVPGVDEDGNGTISYAELDRSIAGVFARIKQHFVLRTPADASKILMTGHELIDEHTARLTLDYSFPAVVSRLDVTSTFDQLAGRPDHQHFVTTMMAGTEEHAMLDAAHRTVTFEHRWWARTSLWYTVAAVVMIGLRAAWYVRSRRRRLLR